MKTPVINIDTGKPCARCRKPGATQNGRCLTCITASIRGESASRRRSKVGTEYSRAPEVGRVAMKLIAEHHRHLLGVRIDFVFREQTDKDGMPQPWVSGGKPRFGETKRVTGAVAVAAMPADAEEPEDFFLVTVCAYLWRSLKEEKRAAHLDHQITRCALDEEKGTPVLRDPDIVEFGEIVHRHGLYTDELATFVQIGAKQLKLDFPAGPKKAAKGRAGKAATAQASR